MQLDLFKDQKSSAAVHVFPVARRRDLIATIMRGLASRNEKQGERFWYAKVREIRSDLNKQGIPKSEIDAQLNDLLRQVQIEIDYRLDRWREG
jgi:hypothetical protein